MTDPRDFTDIPFTIRRADTIGQVEVDDTLELIAADPGTDPAAGAYRVLCRDPSGKLVRELAVVWNPTQHCFEGPTGPAEEGPFRVQISLYQQAGAYPMKALYGIVIERDPQSVGSLAADDQPPPVGAEA
ncbi:MAG: hypothetical protein AAF772_00760 [Acidobacteriota bacterium]